jgi:YidC/Oxa1 family membrane protein insertase
MQMINNPRLLLWILLAFALLLNYQAWQQDYGPQGIQAAAEEAARQAETSAQNASKLSDSVPSAAASESPTPAGASASTAPRQVSAVIPRGGTVRVRTDVLDIDINLQGGTIERADLLLYPKVKGGSEPVRLMNTDPAMLYLVQTGLTGPGDVARPTHLATFTSEQTDYNLGDAEDLRVPLTWTDGNGVTVTKTFIFKRGWYRIDVEQTVSNQSNAPWQAAAYGQLLRNDPPVERSMFRVESYAFRGPAIDDGSKYRKLDIEEDEDRRLAQEVRGGWIAALQHHFVGAIVPPEDETNRFTLNAQERTFSLATAGPVRTIEPGGTTTFAARLFVGPKLQAQLEETGTRLELVADYGMLTILAKPLFLLLQLVHNVIGNWGWAIVIVTFLLKLLFYPLSEASGRSMAKMKTLAPRIKNLQETYKDDREKLGRAMMELYQREKINPVAGCLPIIIQIPVFLAFYWVLLESVEMRQAPFVGWINDLSARDPYFILPLIMAVAMFIQYKLNPTPPDPVQAKVFMIMPIVMSAMFAVFPSGLVLYWVTNTILSIAQQWNINRRIEKAKKT